jgi:hypothetical protein
MEFFLGFLHIFGRSPRSENDLARYVIDCHLARGQAGLSTKDTKKHEEEISW